MVGPSTRACAKQLSTIELPPSLKYEIDFHSCCDETIPGACTCWPSASPLTYTQPRSGWVLPCERNPGLKSRSGLSTWSLTGMKLFTSPLLCPSAERLDSAACSRPSQQPGHRQAPTSPRWLPAQPCLGKIPLPAPFLGSGVQPS